MGERQGQVEREVRKETGRLGERVTPLPPTALPGAAGPGDTLHALQSLPPRKAAGVARGSLAPQASMAALGVTHQHVSRLQLLKAAALAPEGP